MPRFLPPSFAVFSLALNAADMIDLSGPWRVALDPQSAGRAERWFTRELTAPIALPGSLQDRRLGDPVTPATRWTGGVFDKSYFTAPEYAPYREPGRIKVPFWLQPETHYTGSAWFQRTISIPDAWAERRVTLLLERPHWKTTVWLDGREIGSNDSLSVAHLYDLGADLAPGSHRLTLCVDNTPVPDIGENSHSVSDHTQGNWNGIVGRMELASSAPVWIDDLQAYPRICDRTVGVRGRVGRIGGHPFPGRLRLAADGQGPAVDAAIAADGSFAADVALGPDAALWDEFNPVLHRLSAALDNGERREVSFGFRELRAHGRQLEINGRPMFLRGTLDCAAYPRSGHPPTDVETWKRIMGTIKAHGLNHVRFHSWCPPEAAFVAADERGLYLQIEVAAWPNWSTTLGDGKPVDAWIDAESLRILSAYGNHPSFAMLCAGNEPGGDHCAPWLSAWLARRKSGDPRRLYTAASGWPELPDDDYHITPEPRIQHWAEGLGSRINAQPPETRTDYGEFIRGRSVPVVSHEIGQWCAYPDFAEIPEYTGYLKPRNFEIFGASLEAHGLGAQARDFLMASGKLQVLCYKEDIESSLRTPQMGGFQLLGLSDFPGQGTAPVGVLNAFWEGKGYLRPAEFLRFCNSTVPLARLAKRVFTTDEHLVADVEVAHYGPAVLRGVTPVWRLLGDDGRVAAEGRLPAREISQGVTPLGRVGVDLQSVPAPARYKLVVGLEATGFENDWDVWVYPSRLDTAVPDGVTVAPGLSADVAAALETGARVLLLVPPGQVHNAPQNPVAMGFSSIFWNTAWTSRQAPTTLGIRCDPGHPALAEFPTEAFSNWQWWYVVTRAGAMILDDLPTGLSPAVQVIDDWTTNRKLAVLFEARVGRGRLLVCSVDLAQPDDPVRRQLRASLLHYMAGPRFAPEFGLTLDQVRSLMNAPARKE